MHYYIFHGSLIGKIKDNIVGFFVGNYNALIDKKEFNITGKQFAETANYIESRGFDLYADGFVYDKDIIERDSNKEEKDIDSHHYDQEAVNSGKITNVKDISGGVDAEYKHNFTQAVKEYTKMHYYTFRDRNTTGLQKVGRTIFGLLTGDGNDELKAKAFRGFLTFAQLEVDKDKPSNQNLKLKKDEMSEGIFGERFKIDPEERTLSINTGFLNGVNNKFDMNRMGWKIWNAFRICNGTSSSNKIP